MPLKKVKRYGRSPWPQAVYREGTAVTGTYTLEEQSGAYGANSAGATEALRPENTIFWNETSDIAET
jgi:hypothetical protein